MAARPIPDDLLPWASSVLQFDVTAAASLEPVAGDASSRRYFRLRHEHGSFIVAESPPATEKNQAFVAVRALLAETGVRVPDLHAVDLDRGYFVLEDFGGAVLLDSLNPGNVHEHYEAAFELLLDLARMPAKDCPLPIYDEALLREELGRFPEWFATELLACPMDGEGMSIFQGLCEKLLTSALEQPQVLVHRDFHSRNLMLLPAQQLGVIDFQDAVLGPITYDLVSLLRDCYIQWPQDSVNRWALDFRANLQAADLLLDANEQQFLRWFDWMGLQRHLKVLGTFARLYLRDGKTAYLADLPLVITYTQQALDKYAPSEPAFAAFGQWFQQTLGSRIAEQAWSPA